MSNNFPTVALQSLSLLHFQQKQAGPWGSVAQWAPDTPGHAAEACVSYDVYDQHCLESTPAPEPNLQRRHVKHG